jgi:hypothetical protein
VETWLDDARPNFDATPSMECVIETLLRLCLAEARPRAHALLALPQWIATWIAQSMETEDRFQVIACLY